MVTIKRGDHTLVCSKKTYEEQFKNLGYQIASEKKEATEKVASLIDNQEKQPKEKVKSTNKGKTTKKGK